MNVLYFCVCFFSKPSALQEREEGRMYQNPAPRPTVVKNPAPRPTVVKKTPRAVLLVTYTEGRPEFSPKFRIHSVYVKEESQINDSRTVADQLIKNSRRSTNEESRWSTNEVLFYQQTKWTHFFEYAFYYQNTIFYQHLISYYYTVFIFLCMLNKCLVMFSYIYIFVQFT